MYNYHSTTTAQVQLRWKVIVLLILMEFMIITVYKLSFHKKQIFISTIHQEELDPHFKYYFFSTITWFLICIYCTYHWFGGKYGVQTDRVDKSAAGYDSKETVALHSSQTDSKRGFGGKFGVDDRRDEVYIS
jgi:hypothetical protein